MTENWELIYKQLIGNAPLVAALGHAVATPRIFRVEQYKTVNEYDHIVLYSTEEFRNTTATAGLRDVLIFITVLSKKNDSDIEAINELILTDLDEKRVITDDNLYIHGEIKWDNFKTPPAWDEDQKCWASDMRFKMSTSKQ